MCLFCTSCFELGFGLESGARFRLGVTARTSGQSVASSDESLLTFGAETNVLTFLCCKLSTLMSNVVQD